MAGQVAAEEMHRLRSHEAKLELKRFSRDVDKRHVRKQLGDVRRINVLSSGESMRRVYRPPIFHALPYQGVGFGRNIFRHALPIYG